MRWCGVKRSGASGLGDCNAENGLLSALGSASADSLGRD